MALRTQRGGDHKLTRRILPFNGLLQATGQPGAGEAMKTVVAY